MANIHAAFDWSEMQIIGNSMSISLSAANLDKSVASLLAGGYPIPAPSCFIDLNFGK
jgi:hypothetical protein